VFTLVVFALSLTQFLITSQLLSCHNEKQPNLVYSVDNVNETFHICEYLNV